MAGSSPRLRGTSFLHPLHFVGARFIPAPAGNMREHRPAERDPPVHPRACGEHARGKSEKSGRIGSSPRLRGTCVRECDDRYRVRFIPAPAGNIRACTWPPRRPPVHPRACGEHAHIMKPQDMRYGSSPRLRGTCRRCHYRPQQGRFIPAPAGNILS